KQLDGGHRWAELQATLEQLGGRLAARWALLTQWLQALLGESGGVDDSDVALAAYLPEAAALLLVDQSIPSRVSEVDLQVRIEGLLGQHARITAGAMTLGVDEFGQRLEQH